MRIETDRLIIRSIERGDEVKYAAMAKDGSLAEIGFDENFSDWMEEWVSEAFELTRKDDPHEDYIPCTVVLKSTGEVIGNVGCTYYEDTGKVGICYFAGAEFRKKGYVSEAVKAYVPYFFEKYNEPEMLATILDSNVPSWKTAERAGFVLSEIKMYKDIYDEKEKLYRFYRISRD
ncbi:MAG: GNAT family N-acetyltransferase [Lachnospiraceae bacterium]|nr:GNAT family N-acetyltransferase [Lachnospiraceae bacterium]